MTPAEKTRSYAARPLIRSMSQFAPVIFLIALMVTFAILEPRFLSSVNLFNVMRQISITGLVAIGMTFVILTAGIDLSVGSLLALAGLAAAIVAKGGVESRFSVGAATEAAGYGWLLAMLVAMAVGLLGGWLQGTAITRLKVPPFVVTLGGLSAFRGAALLIAGGGPISGFEPAYVWWGQGRVGPFPVPVIIFLLFAAIAHVVLTYTRFGRNVYAVGGNVEAARLAGLPVRWVLCRLGGFRALSQAQLLRSSSRYRLRAHCDRGRCHRRHEPVRWKRQCRGHGHRFDFDRCSHQRPRADERLVLCAADHHWGHYRSRRGIRSICQVEIGATCVVGRYLHGHRSGVILGVEYTLNKGLPSATSKFTLLTPGCRLYEDCHDQLRQRKPSR
jgi:ribose/xylose/arabinose/galactoside ABC-type transport system permease subunit